jgi:hypothetical protein
LAGWEVQSGLAGVADQPGGDVQQPVAQVSRILALKPAVKSRTFPAEAIMMRAFAVRLPSSQVYPTVLGDELRVVPVALTFASTRAMSSRK